MTVSASPLLPGIEPPTYDVPDAELALHEAFFTVDKADGLFAALQTDIPWKQEPIVLFGREMMQPRLTAWVGDEGVSYTYSGITMNPHPWTPELLFIKNQIETISPVQFNSVLLNYYRDGQDSMGWHQDQEPELGRNPVIASVSFGATRPFQLKHKHRKDVPRLDIPLSHGSFLLMQGATQHHWRHRIPKTKKPLGPRMNLTFRKVLY